MLFLTKSAVSGLAVAAVLSSSSVRVTDPQDIAGVRLGMTVAEALAAMDGDVQSVEMQVAPTSIGNQMFWNEHGVMLLTCKGRVTSVSVNVSGGFSELTAVLKQDIAERGPVALDVDNASDGGSTLSSLSAKWPSSHDTYAVTYTVMGEGPATISRAVNVNESCRL